MSRGEGGMDPSQSGVEDGRGSTHYATYIDKAGATRENKSVLKDVVGAVKGRLCGDDPLREFKHQPLSTKAALAVHTLFPILDWGRSYTLTKFRGDLISGLTIASLCIPQDIAYAKLAYLDPQYGLYTSFVPPLVYACMGSSRDIAIGPVAVVSLLLGSMLQSEIEHSIRPVEYRQLAFTATFFAGIAQAALGFFRLGFLVDFLSHAAIVGFMGGAAITIALQQLKGFLGIADFTTKTDLVSVMRSVFSSARHGWNWQTIMISGGFLGLLLLAKHIGKRKKKLFWIPAIAPLICVAVSTLLVYVTRADKHGVKIVKNIKKGVNPWSAGDIYFSGPYVLKGFRIGVVAGMVALTEAIAIGRTFASMKDYRLDGNKEMVALGTMNILGSITSCYVATGSFSRSAVNHMSGCKTAVSNIVMSAVVLLTLLFITPLFHYTPNAILSAIIISAVLNLVDLPAALLILRIDKLDFLACLGAFFGVLFFSVEIGLLISVSISVGKILLQVTRPHTAVLGNLPGTQAYRSVRQYPEARTVPAVLIVRVDSAIYFSNSNYIKERILRRVDEEGRAQEQQQIQFLILDMSPVTDVDTSGVQALEEVERSLKKKGIKMGLANPGETVIEKLSSSGFTAVVGDGNIFPAVSDAVLSYSSHFPV